TNVSVDLYWSPPSTLVTPSMWNAIGAVTVPSVPSGDVLTVSDAITWPAAAIPPVGHYCFVAAAGDAQEPQPGLTSVPTVYYYLTFMKNKNTGGGGTSTVGGGPPRAGPPRGHYRLPFVVAGAFDTSHMFVLETIARLPAGSRAMIEVPGWLADA